MPKISTNARAFQQGSRFIQTQLSSTSIAGSAVSRSFSAASTSSALPPKNLTFENPLSSKARIPSEAVSGKSKRVTPISPVVEVAESTGTASESTELVETETIEDDYIPSPLSNQSLSILCAFTTPPPPSALYALAARLSETKARNSTSSFSLLEDLPLLEQCLIHESFWTGVYDLPVAPLGTTRTFTNYHDEPLISNTLQAKLHSHNGPLATLGNALLGALTSELLLSSFPHLPSRVTKAALTMYAGPKSLAAVATSWGIGPSRLEKRLVGAEDKGKQTSGDRAYGHLVGGVGPGKDKVNELDGAAGMGLVRWNRQPTTAFKDAVLYEDALASVSRSVIGAIYQLHGFEAMREFVHAQFLSRLIPTLGSTLAPATASADITPLLKFTTPSRVLSLTCATYNMPASTHRLLKESGRLSSHPTFLSGVFSGERKLGEGFGSSIKMSEWRASEDALRRLYLGGRVKSGLPSDTWIQNGQFSGLTIGESEVDQESTGRTVMARPVMADLPKEEIQIEMEL